MKRLIPLLLLLCLPAALRAQWQIGVNAGYTYDLYTVNTGYQYDLNYQPQGGLTVAVPMTRRFNDRIGLRLDPSYVQKNTLVSRSELVGGAWTHSLNAYLSLPVMAEFSFGGQYVRGYADAGVYAGTWLSSRVSGEQPVLAMGAVAETSQSFDEAYAFSKKRDNRLDAGLAAGLGVNFHTRGRMGFNLEGRVYYALTSTKNDYMRVNYPAYHTTFVLQAGIFWLLDKSEKMRSCNCE